jgi:hypothetical protein
MTSWVTGSTDVGPAEKKSLADELALTVGR